MKAKRSVLALIELEKLHIADGAIINGRALKEVGISQKLSEKQSENANARWSKNTEKVNKNNGTSDAVAMPAHMPKEYQPEPEPELKKDTYVSLGQLGFPDEKPPPKKQIKRATQIPDGWVPSDRNIQDAISKQFSTEDISHEADQFRDYHTAKGSAFKDWDAAWRTWLGNARKFAGNRPQGQRRGSNRGDIIADAVREAGLRGFD